MQTALPKLQPRLQPCLLDKLLHRSRKRAALCKAGRRACVCCAAGRAVIPWPLAWLARESRRADGLPCAAQIGAVLALNEKQVGRLLAQGRVQLRALPDISNTLYAYI